MAPGDTKKQRSSFSFVEKNNAVNRVLKKKERKAQVMSDLGIEKQLLNKRIADRDTISKHADTECLQTMKKSNPDPLEKIKAELHLFLECNSKLRVRVQGHVMQLTDAASQYRP